MKKRKTLSRTQAKKEVRLTTKSSDQCLKIVTAMPADGPVLLLGSETLSLSFETTTTKCKKINKKKTPNNCNLYMLTLISKF